MMSDAIHEKWAELTDNGVADDRVASLERAFDDLETKLRARFNTPRAALVKLEDAKHEASRALKATIVTQWSSHLVRAMR